MAEQKTIRLAAIDIGSNAVRLLIVEAPAKQAQPVRLSKLNLFRVPLRLGFDVFETGEISQPRAAMFIQTMRAFGHLIRAYGVQHVRAYATSAMRDARNSRKITQQILQETGIEIKIISGDEEASLIYESHIADQLNKKYAYLYIDVGGGSTDLSFFTEGKQQYKQSFNIGTIRLLKEQVSNNDWQELKHSLKKNIKTNLPLVAIGSGGNINKVFSLSKKKDGKPLSLDYLQALYLELASLSIEERMSFYNIKADRADVIAPALQIYMRVMQWANIDKIFVPKIGLADGMVLKLYREI